MAKGVTFGSTHSSSFGAFLSSVTIGEAVVKENKIDIPGANGSLDMTDFFGQTLYENRKVTFEFTFIQRNSELLSSYSLFQQALHGKHFDSIILDDEKNYRYVGRVNVGELKKGVISKVKVECDCFPFKFSLVEKSVTVNVTGLEFPSDYGNVNGDNVIDNRDVVGAKALVGKKTFESTSALRADLNFDGEVTEDDSNMLEQFVLYGNENELKNYVQGQTWFMNTVRNCKRQSIDFGKLPVDVKFKRISENTGLWDLRVDNISQFGLRGVDEFTVRLAGIKEVMITTANIDRTGEFIVTWKEAVTL